MSYTHDELVALAAKFLRKTCSVVVTEMCLGGESPDAIGWGNYGSTTVIECKTTVGDFRADQKKRFKEFDCLGMGEFRWYLTTAGLLAGETIPEGWGLIEVKNGRFFKRKKPAAFSRNFIAEQGLLISVCRRLAQTEPRGVSVNFYMYNKEVKTTVGVERE